jgi:hypothetical protein
MSMGRERLGGRTLLDDAKDRSKDAFAKLPVGSRATVIPLCGPAGSYSLDPLRTQEDAVEAIDAIRVIDPAGTVAQAIDLATQAAERVVDLADKRIVFLGDQQIAGWPADPKSLLARTDDASGRPPLDMRDELAGILGRKVDFCSRLDPRLEPTVRREAVTIYEDS